MIQHTRTKSSFQGLSLLEMSVVVAIVGLLAGVILVGQGLMQRAELRAIVTDARGYATAIDQFKVKYGELPGDIPTAEDIWGTTAGCPTAASVGKATCNGNGNGRVNANPTDASLCEHYRAWQHLAASEFIAGDFTGASGLIGCADNSQLGINSPISQMASAGFSLTSFGDFTSNSNPLLYDGEYDNLLILGSAYPGNLTVGGALTPEAAMQLDEKHDDASPATGMIRAFKPNMTFTPNCVNAANAYNEILRQPACSLFFLHGFAGRA